MQMVVGRTFWDGSMPDAAPAERRAVYEAMIDRLADLHAIDPDAVGLGDYGPPGSYFERQVRRWTKQYRAAQTDELPEVGKADRMGSPRRCPGRIASRSFMRLPHRQSDLRARRAAGRGRARLELSTLGDPLADFAYIAMNWAMPSGEQNASIGGLDLPALGIPTLDEITQRYCARTGRDGIPDLDWYFAFNLFRLLGIVQGIKKRAIDGNASSAKATEMAKRVPMLAAASWGFARKAGAPA